MYRGVNDYIEALGLQTYGIERHDPHAVVRRPSFKFQPVIDLYKRELPALYGRLLRDEGTLLDRHDPNLFDKELDDILISLGERIWPRPGNGSRVHLRKPDPGTRYPDHLIYPRDASTIKNHMRNIILSKQNSRGRVDIDALIEKKDSGHSGRKIKSTPVTPIDPKATPKTTNGLPVRRRKLATIDNDDDSTSSSDNASVGIETRRQALQKSSALSGDSSLQIEMRLYQITSTVFPPVLSLGNILIRGDCTADECFSSIGEHTDAYCNWMVFQLPEDLSPKAKMRVERGSRGSEMAFQGILELFRKAREVRGESLRAIEVEVALDDPGSLWSDNNSVS